MPEHIEGLVAAPHTPMKADGALNLDVVEKQADLLHRNGCVGAFVGGTTGEGMSLEVPERKELAQRWAETAPEGLKTIVHVGHSSVEAAESLAAHAQETGAWGIGAVGPFYVKPSNVEELADCCARIAAAAPDLPFYYYHIPSLTGANFSMVDFLPTASERVASFAGMKFTHEDLADYECCRMFENGRFDILFGRDEMLLSALVLGARGAVGSTYNFAAPLYTKIIAAFDAGDVGAARALQRKAVRLIELLKRSPATFAPAAKAVMSFVGVDCGPPRLPLRALSPEETDSLRRGLDEIGFEEFRSD